MSEIDDIKAQIKELTDIPAAARVPSQVARLSLLEDLLAEFEPDAVEDNPVPEVQPEIVQAEDQGLGDTSVTEAL